MPGVTAAFAFVSALVMAAAPAAADTSSDYLVLLGDRSAVSIATQFGERVDHTYDSAVRGFAATLTKTQARDLAADPAVTAVVPDTPVQAAGEQVNPPSWGLDRIDQRDLPFDGRYRYPNTTPQVTGYVIDTGVRATHQDFGGRVSGGYDFIDDDTVPDDANGHGTFVAGVFGGTRYGVAKDARIVPVRVLDATGGGTVSDVIAGIDWVTKNARKPAVANISIGGSPNAALDQAVRGAIASGVTITVASGASATDAGNFSPARVTEALTIASSDQTDRVSSSSNHGPLIDLYAPGVGITSTWNTNDTAAVTISGTSFAAPHVAGAAAIYLQRNPAATPAQVSAYLVATATTGRLIGVRPNTANRLLYVHP